MQIHKKSDETELQFLWRLGNAKKNGIINISWAEIANIMNSECRTPDEENYGESRYRKMFQSGERFYNEGVFSGENEHIAELVKARQELFKEKQRVQDERRALNKILRESARNEADLQHFENLIKTNSFNTLPIVENSAYNSEQDFIIPLSDFHLGINASNYFGEYNSEIAKKRLGIYLNEILKLRDVLKPKNAYLLLLGDLVAGELHITTQLENRENLTEQVQTSAELISAFVYELSKHFDTVYVNSVGGNHSRTSFKDEVLRGNRLDNLIPWYMKAKLSHIQNVAFVDYENYDSTIGCTTIRDKKYLLVHGDFDSYSEKGVSKLLLMLDLKPSDIEAIFYGHLHKCSYDEVADVKIVRSGSFCGTVDDFTVSHRLKGRPSQMVCLINQKGLAGCFPIDLRG